MPLAFPSHQGLILPLWRRWPNHFDGVALSVGAAMPDIVDALLWPIRGELGQGLGHSLIGILFFSIPLGLIVTKLVRRFTPAKWLVRLSSPSLLSPGLSTSVVSLGVGALSHVFFDLITHANFPLLLPWYQNDEIFPSWWRHAWIEIPLFVYRKPYPIGPHFIAWTVLSLLGIVMFLRSVRVIKTEPR